MLVSRLEEQPIGYATFRVDLWLDDEITLRAFYSLLRQGRFFSMPDEEIPEGLFARSRDQQEEVTVQLGAQALRSIEILVQRWDRINRERRGALLVSALAAQIRFCLQEDFGRSR